MDEKQSGDAALAEEIAKERLRQALKLIEQAQNNLNEACSMLCPIIGMIPEWRATGKCADRIKSHWYRVRNRASAKRIRVDDGHLADYKQRAKP